VQEAGVMASMRHPHIVSFMGVCTAPPAIVTEYCERGSLTSLLQAAKALPERAAELTWRFRIKMVSEIWE
jgi:serine/threonine protein kinase